MSSILFIFCWSLVGFLMLVCTIQMLRLVHVHFALQLNHLCRDFQMMTFQGTSMLQKPVPEYRRISQEKLKIGSY